MAGSFAQKGDDIKKLAGISEFEDSDISLSDNLELFQLLSLEKAISEGKDLKVADVDGTEGPSLAALAGPLVAQQIKYMKIAAATLADDESLQNKYGYGMKGVKKLADYIYKLHATEKADAKIKNALNSSGTKLKKGNGAFGGDKKPKQTEDTQPE